MTPYLAIHHAGPALTVQDLGRPGHMASGLSRGGAADRLAMAEGAALLGQDAGLAALEMAGFGGVFELSADGRIALTGAPMKAMLDGRPMVWNATHHVKAGQKVSIGASLRGFYGYLHLAGGIAVSSYLDSRSTHLAAGLGAPLENGCRLPLGPDSNANAAATRLSVKDRFSGGVVRVLPSAQTCLFSDTERRRFEDTAFTRSPRGNRQGVGLNYDGAPFSAGEHLSILSEIMVPGDIQMTGDGTPFVLLPECQTTGGYPRIGTVLPQDLPIVAQAAPGTRLRFCFILLEEGLENALTTAEICAGLIRQRQPLIRNPHDIHDLLSYQLISGVTAGEPDKE